MILPRVGWELSVAFLEAIPIGRSRSRVYNAEKVPPYALPATKTSASSNIIAGAGGHNEIVMGDSAGSQGFGIHAQKDLNVSCGTTR